jgi:hypothetical protein
VLHLVARSRRLCASLAMHGAVPCITCRHRTIIVVQTEQTPKLYKHIQVTHTGRQLIGREEWRALLPVHPFQARHIDRERYSYHAWQYLDTGCWLHDPESI